MAEPQLRRTLTWVEGTAMAIGAVLGSGVLILPAITAQQAGPASILSWLLMSLLAFPLAMTLGRLGVKYPHAGGIVEYARLAFGPIAGHITAWLFLGTIPIGVPIIALVGANYVAGTFGLPHWTIPLMAAVMLLVSLALHGRGIDIASWTQVLILLLIAILMVSAIVAAEPSIRVSNFYPVMPHGWLPVGTSAVEIFWCFVGWEMVAHMAEEFRDPALDLRRTFLLAPTLAGGLYIALSIVTVGTHAYGSVEGSAPLGKLVGIGLGQAGSMVTGGLALLITMVALHGNIAGFSRMVYSQARIGVFPSFLGRLHKRYATPTGALMALGANFAVVLTIYTMLHVNLGALITWPSTLFLVLYAIAMLSALKLLKGQGWFRQIVPLIPLLVSIGLYTLSGWAMMYPVLLAGAGWLGSRRNIRKPSRINRHAS
jgi:amino acid efflux transporter